MATREEIEGKIRELEGEISELETERRLATTDEMKISLDAISKCSNKQPAETPVEKKPKVVDVEPTAQDQEDFRKAQEDFKKAQEEREALRKQYNIGSTNQEEIELPQRVRESKIQKNYFLNPIKNRHEQLEKLVFERLVKGCK